MGVRRHIIGDFSSHGEDEDSHDGADSSDGLASQRGGALSAVAHCEDGRKYLDEYSKRILGGERGTFKRWNPLLSSLFAMESWRKRGEKEERPLVVSPVVSVIRPHQKLSRKVHCRTGESFSA